jgi:pimeloyl-ACP methyl ester carboxylesterase
MFSPPVGCPSWRRSDGSQARRRSRNISIHGPDPGVARSWLALAGAADNRYTQEMLPALLQSRTPKLLVWGEDDPFQTVDYAERYAHEIPETRLVRIKSAGHIPRENDAKAVAGALADFFAAEARSA